MNYWEVGNALSEAASAIKQIPGSIINNASEDVEQKYKEMTATVVAAQEFSRKCIAELKELDDKHLEEVDRICADVRSRVKMLKACFEDISYSDLSRVRQLAEAIKEIRQIHPDDLEMIVELMRKGRKT